MYPLFLNRITRNINERFAIDVNTPANELNGTLLTTPPTSVTLITPGLVATYLVKNDGMIYISSNRANALHGTLFPIVISRRVRSIPLFFL